MFFYTTLKRIKRLLLHILVIHNFATKLIFNPQQL